MKIVSSFALIYDITQGLFILYIFAWNPTSSQFQMAREYNIVEKRRGDLLLLAGVIQGLWLTK